MGKGKLRSAGSPIVQANDGFDFALSSTASPGQKIDCHVCFTPILNGSAMGLDLAGDYPDCATVSYTMPDNCKCNLVAGQYGFASGNTTESGGPCPGWSDWFDLNLGVVTITGPDQHGAFTADGTPSNPNKYCTGCEATKTRYDLCGCGNAPENQSYTGNGGDPTYDPWEPAVDKVCAGVSFQQYRVVAANSCRACNTFLGPQAAVGTMQPDWSGWHPNPDLSQICDDTKIQQRRYDKNGCDPSLPEQYVYGTKVCSDCECPEGWLTARPASSVVTGEPCPEGQTLQTASGSGNNPCETCYKCEADSGCTNPNATNYNSSAKNDDGSCLTCSSSGNCIPNDTDDGANCSDVGNGCCDGYCETAGDCSPSFGNSFTASNGVYYPSCNG